MPIFNNPAIGQAASQFASLFAPPSGADAAGWAGAAAKREEAKRLADFYGLATSGADWSQIDRAGIGAGVFAPTQSMRSVEMGDATARYGVDVGASTSRANNTADNTRALDQTRLSELAGLFGPVSQGAARPAVPANIATMFGAPGQIDQFEGPAKPLSESEVKGAERQRLADSGQLTDQMMLESILGERSPVQVAGPQGQPVYQTPGAAIGQPAYVNRGAQAAPKTQNYITPSGQGGNAVFDLESQQWVDTNTRSPIPAGSRTYTGQLSGSADETGLGKPATNYVERQLIDTSIARDTAVTLRGMIQNSPASQGAVGWLRGTAQNVLQTGDELGTFFGGRLADVERDIQTGAADAGLAGAFDPNIPAIEMLSNLLAFQYAKTTTGERLSNEMLRASKAALGLDGLTANRADAIARLNQAIDRIDNQARILQSVRSNGIGSVGMERDNPVPVGDVTARPPAPSAEPAPDNLSVDDLLRKYGG